MYRCAFCVPASLRDKAPRLPELECGACRTGFDATDIDLYLQCSNANCKAQKVSIECWERVHQEVKRRVRDREL